MQRLPQPTQLSLPFDFAKVADPRQLVAEAVRWAGNVPTHGLAPAEQELLRLAAPRRGHADRHAMPDSSAQEEAWSEQLGAVRSIEERRDLGQFFTPWPIAQVMVHWCQRHTPGQIVDAGCGTGRFAITAAQALPQARILAIDSDPVATLLCRAQVQKSGLHNVEVRCADFLTDDLSLGPSPVAFIGNPPYVRHHRLSPSTKRWGADAARKIGIPFSGLAGLHVYFFLATALRARPGDIGCFITSAEWLDVGYGKGLRQLLTKVLGLCSLSLLDESSAAFPDAMTSAVITCFQVGRCAERVALSAVDVFQRADGPADSPSLSYHELGDRWGAAVRGSGQRPKAEGAVRLGEIATVHRGIATGANDFFVMTASEAKALGIQDFARPVISGAKQIIHSGGSIDGRDAKVLILLPKDVRSLAPAQRKAAEAFLTHGTRAGIPQRYLCQHRKPWWYLGKPVPPPIVASYMARRPPAFALNPNGLHILNIAHGIYPHRRLSQRELTRLVASLNERAESFVGNGRRYQGGLEKFEPREMEDLLISPGPPTDASA